ncbi:MAG: AAA-associated domain-containing protein [Thermoplasmata archaeon]
MTEVIDPNARIADLVGLLYVLTNIFNGKTDLYKLEKEMEVDLDDLMPIVYTAVNLGFVTLDSGDINVTEKGREFAKLGIKKRKEMIRESIKNMEPFITALNLKRFTLQDLMEELLKKNIYQYNSPSGYHDLEVILIEWGIYSGLLKKEEDYFVTNTGKPAKG